MKHRGYRKHINKPMCSLGCANEQQSTGRSISRRSAACTARPWPGHPTPPHPTPAPTTLTHGDHLLAFAQLFTNNVPLNNVVQFCFFCSFYKCNPAAWASASFTQHPGHSSVLEGVFIFISRFYLRRIHPPHNPLQCWWMLGGAPSPLPLLPNMHFNGSST